MDNVVIRKPLACLVLSVLACAGGACGSTVATATGPSPAKCAVTLALPTSPVGSGGDATTVGVTTQPECAWSASSDAAWISGLTPSSGQGSAQLQMQVAANPGGTARQGDIIVNGERGRIRQDAAPCAFELSATEQTISAAGGTGRITVTAVAGCAWSAQTDAAWVVLTGGATGTGTGSVTFTIASNPGATTRAASIVVAGQTVQVTQQATVSTPPTSADCSVTVTPRDVSFLAAGTSNSSISVTAASSCEWSASTETPWISLTGRTSGTGNGAVTFSVAANTGGARSGALTIGDQTVPVNQAGTTCSYTVTPLTTSVTAAGGAGPQVTISTQPGCAWTATSNATWLSITSAASGSGDAAVSFSASTNTGAARSGTLTVAGQTVTVSQSSASCSYSVKPSTLSIPADGSTGTSVSVKAAAECAWSASSNASWISIASGSGSGNGTVTIVVAANNGAARSGTLAIADQAVTVNQAAAPCTYSVSPTTLSALASGGPTGPVTVTTATGCEWTATSNVSWLSITAGASGSGTGTVSISAAANTGAARTGTLTVAGQSVTVSQSGSCTYGISPTKDTVDKKGGTGKVSVTTQSGCGWTAVSDANWITITSGSSGIGNGTVEYSVTANTTGSNRTGTLTIAGGTFTLTQKR